MSTLSQSPGFQTQKNYKIRLPPPLKTSIPISSIDESLGIGRIPYASIRLNKEIAPILPSPPDRILKHTTMTPKRRSSTISLSNLIPRRKSLQTTVLATRRQSLWMNISKNASANDNAQLSILPLRQDHSSLMRKKILRLLLVFSYLLSISLFAIALATFYGVFWSGYTTSDTTNILNIKSSVRSLISLTTNSTFVDSNSEQEDDLLMKSIS